MTDQTPDPWKEADRALFCLRIAVAESIADDIKRLVDAARALDAQRLQQAQQEIADLTAAAQEPSVCVWTVGFGYSKTGCGNSNTMLPRNPDKQGWGWCPYCGKPLSLTPEAHHD